MTPQQEARLVELQRKKDTTPAEMKELQRLQGAMDRATNQGAQRAERGETGTRGEMKKPLFKSGGSVKSSASRRADGIATKGKTKGRII